MNAKQMLIGQSVIGIGDAFDAGARTVLYVVFGNLPLGESGLSSLTKLEMEQVRELRQKVHGRFAYQSATITTPRKKRPARKGKV